MLKEKIIDCNDNENRSNCDTVRCGGACHRIEEDFSRRKDIGAVGR